MYTETEGIIFKQIKTMNGRRMIVAFTRKYGKISAGTSIAESGKNKSALALRPFTYGRYELFRNRNSCNIIGAESIKSYYAIGEDIDKFLYASYTMEFAGKILEEDQPLPELFDLILEFMSFMEGRDKKFSTPVIAFQIKALHILGQGPRIDDCVFCGTKDNISYFSVKDGGAVCRDCSSNINRDTNVSLIYDLDEGIINILRYFLDEPLGSLEKVALNSKMLGSIKQLLKGYMAYHLDISDLKSEGFLSE